jgi:hypothetical protein
MTCLFFGALPPFALVGGSWRTYGHTIRLVDMLRIISWWFMVNVWPYYPSCGYVIRVNCGRTHCSLSHYTNRKLCRESFIWPRRSICFHK